MRWYGVTHCVRAMHQICSECRYQAASRNCKACDKKSHDGVLYCDVCYINAHRDKAHEDPELLTVLCCECELYTAKWMRERWVQFATQACCGSDSTHAGLQMRGGILHKVLP